MGVWRRAAHATPFYLRHIQEYKPGDDGCETAERCVSRHWRLDEPDHM